MMVPKMSLNGSVENHDFEPMAHRIFRDTVAELAAKAKATLPDVVNGRVDKAVAIVLAGDVELMSDGRAVVGRHDSIDQIWAAGVTPGSLFFCGAWVVDGRCRGLMLEANVELASDR